MKKVKQPKEISAIYAKIIKKLERLTQPKWVGSKWQYFVGRKVKKVEKREWLHWMKSEQIHFILDDFIYLVDIIWYGK